MKTYLTTPVNMPCYIGRLGKKQSRGEENAGTVRRVSSHARRQACLLLTLAVMAIVSTYRKCTLRKWIQLLDMNCILIITIYQNGIVQNYLTISDLLPCFSSRLGKKQCLRIEDASTIRRVLHVAAPINTCQETSMSIGNSTDGANLLSMQKEYPLVMRLLRKAINANVTQIYATHYSGHFKCVSYLGTYW